MKVCLRVLADGTRVRIRQPARGERVTGSGLDDPAYDLCQERTG